MAAELLAAQALRLPQLGGASVPLSMPGVPSLADNADAGKVKVTEGDIPDVLGRKLSQNGSIVAVGNTLCLRGEEGGKPGGVGFYGTNQGVSGFFSLSQMDPYAGGMPLAGTGDTPDGGSVQLDGKQGASVRIGGRSHLSIDIDPDKNVWLVVKDFYRMADLSPNGRIVRVSKEIEVPVLRLKIGGGSGNGKYGVRMFSIGTEGDAVHPRPDAFAFGAEADLDTYDESTGQFECNYRDGALLDDPPVKVVMTVENTAGGGV